MWQLSRKDKNSLVNGLGQLASKIKFVCDFAIHFNKFQMDQNSKCKKLNLKVLEDEKTYFWVSMERAFKDITQTPEAIKKRLINLIL